MDQIPEGQTLTTAPPPPTEVKIRTMKSDIAMLAASGGGAPHFANVAVAGLSAKKESSSGVARDESKSNLLLIVVLVVVFVALLIVGWFVYLRLK
jgi:hypothetical protein